MGDWKEQYNLFAEQTNIELKQQLADAGSMYSIIRDAMAYSLFSGGKRVRAVLLLAAAALFQEKTPEAIAFAAAIEMIHTYSLIHDDLPSMDNDDYRRGNPTSHKVFGEANAILTGDALLNMAYEIMSEEANAAAIQGDLNPLAAMKLIAKQAGARGMIAGQAADLENENNTKADEKLLMYIDTHKTGALIEAATLSGAILAGASAKEQHALLIYASNLGLAFQASDDILDETGTAEEMGKSIGKDQVAGKATFVSLYGVKKTQRLIQGYIQHACDALQSFGERAELLQQLVLSQADRSF